MKFICTIEQGGVKTNTTIHKQIIDLLEESGTKGMTLNVNLDLVVVVHG